MTKNIMRLMLLVLICWAFVGCGETNETQKSILDVAESKYDSYELRKARDEAKIEKLKNLTEQEKAEHKILLIAAGKNIRLVDANDDVVTKANYKAADYLLKKLPKKIFKDAPILVANFVNLDDLKEAATFGKVISEQISSRLKQRGYTVIEMKLRAGIFIMEDSGEFSLSQELSEISARHSAQAIVVGTYAAAADRVYLTARVINVIDSTILASYDYNIPMTRDVFKMLMKGKEGVDWL